MLRGLRERKTDAATETALARLDLAHPRGMKEQAFHWLVKGALATAQETA
jgi:hypothetical protein